MIKYLGSKRRLVPVLGDLLGRVDARTALDLFTGTTRVAQEWKRRRAEVWAVDLARYAEVLAGCYIATDCDRVDRTTLGDALSHLDGLPGVDGYMTATFSHDARFFQPHNARRIDAIRDEIQRRWAGDPLEPVLLTSLLEAADRVDSTTGLQMAYLKQWAPRSYQRLTLRAPVLLPGPGHAVGGDATVVAAGLPEVDLAYLDPPYNQHRYFTNYHVWETLVAWDAPAHYGVACKRLDAREASTKSVFNDRRRAPDALAHLIAGVRAATVVISGSNEGWVGVADLVDMAAVRGHVEVLAFDSRRYIGAQIGIHNLQGEKVGRVSHTRNVEYLICAGEPSVVRRLLDSDSSPCHCHAGGVHPG
ncbi:MAG: DNA adenine methylase [Actinomycetota bacterium]|nr:DNA adenine methylase [Actinomycetota bacterium]